MEYYRILNLVREPFSNSPEPEFFYESRHHVDCLQRMEVALRLRRGLNVVIGQVGAGKTTLSRQLIRKFSGDTGVKTYLLLDPHFSTEMEFLFFVAHLFGLIEDGEGELSAWQLRERIKNFLFEQAVEKDNLIVLIIDEGQKIPDFALESLREFLNYETNEHKLLQIGIFAQEEFRLSLERNPGFADRINLIYHLGPLNFKDTRAMVLFRMKQATERGREVPIRFTRPSLRAIYKATGGYPRKIVRMCHQVLLTLIIQNRSKADWWVVRAVIGRSDGEYGTAGAVDRTKGAVLAGLVVVLMLLILFGLRDQYVSSLQHYLPSMPWAVTGAEQSATRPAVFPLSDSATVSSADGNKDDMVSHHGASEDPIREGTGESSAKEEDQSIESMENAAVPAADNAPAVSSEVPVQQNIETTPPVTLGHITIARNQFLWNTLKVIYGAGDDRVLKYFNEMNPSIRNIDHVMEGQRLTMPAIPASIPQAYRQGFWIRLAEAETPDEAYEWYRKYSRSGLSLRVVSWWTETGGLRFSIVVKQKFSESEEARNVLLNLPGDIAGDAAVIPGWPEGALFFGDW